jgi:hypothetical protein
MYVNLDMEQKPLQYFPSPQKVLHNFKSVFITGVIRDCLEAELMFTVTAS